MMNLKRIKCCFFTIPMLLLAACDAIVDESGDLGGGYNFKADGGMMWITGSNVYEDGIPGNVTDYISNSYFIMAKQKPSRDYYRHFYFSDLRFRYYFLLYNKDVVQSPNELQKRFMQSKWWSDSELKSKVSKLIPADNNLDRDEELNSIVDSVITHDPEYKRIFSSKVNFWILVKQGNLVYGPLVRQEYDEKRKELSIPDELDF